ncbi:MAG: EamA family transporter [Desulfovibrionaceae bacterium]|nr:EamA family transporter [Desulfovibrionaceae bacterium]
MYLAKFWPIVLIVCSNILYNIASKSLPKDCNPFGALIVTYITATILSALGFFILDPVKNPILALQKVNWAGVVLGISMVGLEIGFIFLYRTGWSISTASLIAHILVAAGLLLIGILWYRENISVRQYIGIAVSLIGVAILLTER